MRRYAPAFAVLLLATTTSAQMPVGSLEQMDADIATLLDTVESQRNERERVGAEMEGLTTEYGTAQRRLRTRVRALYRMRRAGVLPLAGGFEALLRHQSRIERLERMVAHDLAATRSFTQRVSALEDEKTRLDGDIEARERELSTLREQKAAFERATIGMWAGIAPSPTWNDGMGMRLSDSAAPRTSFAALHGRLSLPVGGSARVTNAEREGGAGIELAASIGSGVRAVAPGRVAYSAQHPAYGRLVILDHGEGYYTVYGGLETVAVAVGQSAVAGTPLGTVGVGAMFFQVRQGTRPLPAREWLGL